MDGGGDDKVRVTEVEIQRSCEMGRELMPLGVTNAILTNASDVLEENSSSCSE